MIIELLSQYLVSRLFLYQLLATLSTYSVITTALFVQKRRARFSLFEYYGIPGQKPRLLDGNHHEYLKEKQCYLVDLDYYKRYGRYYGYFIGDEPSIVVTDLDLLKKVFFERTSSFKNRGRVFLDTNIALGVLFAPHHRWKFMRKVMSPTFNGYVMRGNSSTEFIEESIRLLLENIEDKFNSAHPQEGRKMIVIDIQDLMKAVALHMISNMAIKLQDVAVKEGESHVRNLDEYLSASDKGIVIWAIRFPFLKRILTFLANRFEFNEAMKLIHQSLNSKIDNSLKSLANHPEEHELKAEQPHLIDTLIKLHHEGKMSRIEVMGNAEAILIAGYDTTSTTLSYIFWVLGKFPHVQERLRSELMAHGIKSKYLDQVINETMRLYPTVINFVSRLASETVVIDDLTIPRGARVVYNSWLMNRNPTIWPEPEKFDPERFREGVERHPCAFAPFGLSERRCLGYSLAQLEMKMIICDLLMRYRIKTKVPNDLELISNAVVLTKSREKILIELEKL